MTAKGIRAGIGLAMLLSIVFLYGSLNPPAQACCTPPQDKSVKTYESYCKNRDYDLKFRYYFITYDVESITVYGVCHGNYLTCSCDFIGNMETPGVLSYSSQPILGGAQGYNLWWTAWNKDPAQYSSCSSGACQQTGLNETLPFYSITPIGYTSVEGCQV